MATNENYYTILTSYGKQALANAQASGTAVNITEFAVGDGNGSYYTPNETQTALKNEVYRAQINRITTDSDNPNWIIVEGIIPADQGGFTIREVGIFDDQNKLIAIGNYPETYKPVLSQGAGNDMYIRFIMEVENVDSVQLKIDPAIVLASRKYVDDEINNHNTDATAHNDMRNAITDLQNNKATIDLSNINSLGKILDLDGSGSGLDADKLDGLNASQFVRSDVDDTITGRLTIVKNVDSLAIQPTGDYYSDVSNNRPCIRIKNNDGSMLLYLGMDASEVAGTIDTYGEKFVLKSSDFQYSPDGTNQYKVWTDWGAEKNFGTNGYQKLPSGLIIQWGTITSTSDTEETFNFPITFPNAVLALTVQVKNLNGSDLGAAGIGNPFSITSFSTSSFTIDRDDDIDGQPILWFLAIGY